MSKAYDMFLRLLQSTTYTIAQSYYDDFVETNCTMKASAGINQMIIRRQMGKCCDWCASLAGSYEIADTPKDIYKRHRNCRCLVTSKNIKGYTDVWTKKVSKTQREARIKRQNEILENFRKQKEGRITAKNIDNLLSRDYYKSPAKVKELQERFESDSDAGWFNASIGFNTYFSDYVRIEEEIVGLKTTNGIKLTSQSRHLITRIFGTLCDPVTGNQRAGVTVDEIKDALIHGTPEKENGNSQIFIGKHCKVVINPKTGNIVSAWPKRDES